MQQAADVESKISWTIAEICWSKQITKTTASRGREELKNKEKSKRTGNIAGIYYYFLSFIKENEKNKNV